MEDPNRNFKLSCLGILNIARVRQKHPYLPKLVTKQHVADIYSCFELNFHAILPEVDEVVDQLDQADDRQHFQGEKLLKN